MGKILFNFYQNYVSLGRGLSISESFGWNFADVTLADDDTNSILTAGANRAIGKKTTSIVYKQINNLRCL